jgi:bacillithiol biosynthesis deacetylase BshB1
LIDVTRGEGGSRGSAAERAAEAAAAARLLGLCERGNLGLRDTGVEAGDGNADLLVRALRSARPRLLLAPHPHDVHPDHVAVAALAARAYFLAGLVRHAPELGAPFRPALLLRYPSNQPVEPSIAVDISRVAAQKADVLRCYRSQIDPPDRSHLVQGLDVLERAEVRDRFFGARIGAAAAEPFWHDGPLPVRDAALLLA